MIICRSSALNAGRRGPKSFNAQVCPFLPNLPVAKKIYLLVMLALALAGIGHTQTTDSSLLQLVFKNVVGKDSLELGKEYSNAHGETFTVTNFKYYLKGFYLIEKKSGNKLVLGDDYFLVEERKPETKSISLGIVAGQYSAIGFSIGVDSLHNVSGMQEGALDPVNGMFWTWNTGYIMAKLEGKSPLSKAPFSNITYHIGGFKSGENVLREVLLPLPYFTVTNGSFQSEINISANINAWFAGAHDIKIAEHAFFMNPGAVAVKIADNYANMFTVESCRSLPQ
jgi:hypothetical protein